ncbi:MAG: sigma-70 family RNA polymerase sigma factor [Patescibacteria group bacterium]
MDSSETIQILGDLYPKGVASPNEVLRLIKSLGRSSKHCTRTVRALLQLCDVVLYAPVIEVEMPEPSSSTMHADIALEEEEAAGFIDHVELKDQTLEFFFNLAKQYQSLTHAQQCNLACKHRDHHDGAALQQLILHNLRLVIWTVNRSKTHLDYLDAVQAGCMGLMCAAEKYDERLGTQFSTYAYISIKQHIKRAEYDEKKLVRCPVYVEEQIRQYDTAFATYCEKQESRPSDAEMATVLKWSQEKVVEYRLLTNAAYVTERVSPGDEEAIDIWDTDECASETTPEMLVAQKEEYLQLLRSTRERLRLLLVGKNKRDRDIFLARYGIDRPCLSPRTLDDVGEMFELTRERIRQIVMNIWRSGGEQWRNLMAETEVAFAKIQALREFVNS